MQRAEVRIKKEFKNGKWIYEMPEGGRRISDETITHNSSLYGVMAVEHYVIADVPNTEEEEPAEEEQPAPKKAGRPKNREEE